MSGTTPPPSATNGMTGRPIGNPTGSIINTYGLDPAAVASQTASITGGGGGGGSNDPTLYWGPYVYSGSQYAKAPRPTYHSSEYYSQVPTSYTDSEGAVSSYIDTKRSPDYYSQVPSAGQEDYKNGPTPMTVSGATNYMMMMLHDNPEEFYRIGERLNELGWVNKDGKGYDQQDVIGAWTDIAKIAAAYYNDGKGVYMTMNQVMNMYGPNVYGNGFGTNGGKTTGIDSLVPHTETDSQAYVSSASEIKGTARTVAQQELGRDLSDSELNALISKVQGAQAAAPRVTHTITDPTSETNVNRTETIHGGLDATTYITDQARENPDYAEHQAAATYMPALFQALRATV